MSKVLVTGGSGFIGSQAILQLLAAGHQVRATLRSLGREAEVRRLLEQAGAPAGDNLSFAEADLTLDAGWTGAAAGCEFVLHIASPFPAGKVEREDDLVVPAREGALRVLRASRDAGVKRVVLTSSFAAIGYGHAAQAAPFTEEDWTDLSGGDVAPYIKSKTLAERAAWDFMAREGGKLELAVVNPVGVFGPLMGPDLSSSIQIVKSLLEGAVRACPKIHFGVVDVRDVVDLHLRAMAHSAAKGQRFLAVAGDSLSMLDVAKILRAGLGQAAHKVPKRQVPSWVLRLMALGDPGMSQMLPQLGKVRRASNAKAKQLLGWSPRSSQEAILATAESLLKLGLVKA
jgi:nucleoside-diphosphate-sugar epimerase